MDKEQDNNLEEYEIAVERNIGLDLVGFDPECEVQYSDLYIELTATASSRIAS